MKPQPSHSSLFANLRAASMGLVFAVVTLLFGQGLGIVFGLNEDAGADHRLPG